MISVLAAGALLFSAQPSSTPRFRTEARRVFVDVFVTRKGRPVDGLGVEDFEVFDDGALQRGVSLLSAHNPLSVALVLDGSASVRG